MVDQQLRPAPTRIRWQVLALACGASFLLYVHRYSWNIVGPELQADFQLTNTQSQFLFSLFYYTYSAGQIPSGVVIDRFGPHKFLSVVIATWSISLIALAQTSQMFLLGFWRLAFGATQAGCYPALSKISSQWFPLRQRTTLQGVIATLFGRGGGAMSPIILGTCLMSWCGLTWQMGLTILGIAGGLYCLLFWALFRNSPEEDPRVNDEERALIRQGQVVAPGRGSTRSYLPAGRVWRNRSMRFFVVQQFLDAGSDVAYVSLIGAYFLQAHGFEIGKTGWLASLPLWGGALGGIVGGWLNDRLIRSTGNRRWSRSGVGFTGKAIGCCMLWVMMQQSSGEAAAVMLMAAKFFGDWSQPTTWGMCTDLGGRFSATVFSIINTAGTLGGVVMPIIFGGVLDWFTIPALADGTTLAQVNWNPLFFLLSAMYLASGTCWLLIDCTQTLHDEAEQQ